MTTSGTWCRELGSPQPCFPTTRLRGEGQLPDAFTQMTHSLQEMAAAQGEWGRVHGTGIWMSEPLWGGGHGEKAQNVTVILMVGCQGSWVTLSGEQRRAGPGGFRAEGT